MRVRHLIKFLDGNGRMKIGEPVPETIDALQQVSMTANLSKLFAYETRMEHASKFTRTLTTPVSIQKLLAPVPFGVFPPAIYCVGLNYRKHIMETNQRTPTWPTIFMKPPTSVCHPFDPIRIPKICQTPTQVDYEAELAIVIGKQCLNTDKKSALDYVLGYTCANDVSARDWQKVKGGGQWDFAKGFDTFCPLGPLIALRSEGDRDPDLSIHCILKKNGRELQEMQNSRTSDMLFKVSELVSFLSQGRTLLPGTVILTGTPEGVGMARKPQVFMQDGDSVSIKIESIGSLNNPIVYE